MGDDLSGAVVFVPGDPPRASTVVFLDAAHSRAATAGQVELVLPHGSGAGVRRRAVPGRVVPLTDALPALLATDLATATPSAAAWATALAAGVNLVARGRLLPAVSPGGWDTWRAGPLDSSDLAFLAELAAAFPPLAHALPVPHSRPLRVRAPESLIRAAWDAVADTLARTPAAETVAGGPLFAAEQPQQAAHLAGWLAEGSSALDAGARLELRIELPDIPDADGRAVLQLRSSADPSLAVEAGELWRAPTSVLSRFGTQAEADLALAVRRGARTWPALGPLLHESAPVELPLDDDALADLLDTGGERLAGAGIEVLWPAELMSAPLGSRAVTRAPAAAAGAGFTLNSLVEFDWQLTLGGDVLTAEEVDALAEAKRPVVRLRGRWVTVDRHALARLRARRARPLSAPEALAAALTGELEVDGEHVSFLADGPLADLVRRLGDLAADQAGHAEPEGLTATLRGYQRRGLTWLAGMCEAGLGACLADDMGLGKTVQVIALHLARRPLEAGPSLVVCPTSLVGNWQREVARFAPDVPVRRYVGADRSLADLAADEMVLVTYGVLRRDRAALAETSWGLVVADEAQHVKNPLSRSARELRGVPAAARVALTGTPVENRLSDLWAILDWTTPGLLGPLETFRRSVAIPVEKYHDPATTERLATLVRPFLLRRRKTDPGIAPELPRKTETDEVVPLSPEQATLYEAVVRETVAEIEQSEGMARRGLVLKLLTALKQICNHPAQYLRQAGPLPGRSGKLVALDEILDIVTAEGDAALVFTQYVAMARLLESHLAGRGVATLFLHGGTPAKRREEMVAAFQSGAAPVFLLSLKAGGVGLNLTRATHVLHYDRWWNPAVEDQATDRAYRIGQDRPVQVHRLVTEGTVEDRLARLLADKRALSEAVVGAGETWLTELTDSELRDLVRLGDGS